MANRRFSRPSFSTRPKVVSPLLAGFMKGLTKIPIDLDLVPSVLPSVDLFSLLGTYHVATASDSGGGAGTLTCATVPDDELWFAYFWDITSTNIDIDRCWFQVQGQNCYVDINAAGVTHEFYQFDGTPLPSGSFVRCLTANDVGADSISSRFMCRRIKVQ